ncbi:MAG: hypothetical protein ACI9JN_002588 [Bacteroidia bacterium]|jgi:hypothetical protein
MKEEHTSLKFYSNGTTYSETSINYPNGLLEAWIEPIDKVIKTNEKIEAYLGGELLYTEDLVVDVEELVLPQTFAPYYLSTNNWNLPLSASDIIDLDLSGYSVPINTSSKLMITSEFETLSYDKFQWTEEYIQSNETGDQVSRKLILYKPDAHGYLLYDLIVQWTLDSRTTPCVEKVTYQNYSNVKRIFHNPICAPTKDNGHEFGHLPLNAVRTISANQIEGTHFIYIEFPDDVPEKVWINVKDLFGGVIQENIEINTSNPYLDLGELPTGVFNLSILNQNIQPCKFLYQA